MAELRSPAVVLRPAQEVLAGLGSDAGPGTRRVVEWFAAQSDQRTDDAWAMMDPAGSYYLLRQRKTIAIGEFTKVMAGLVGTVFARSIAWSLGGITEQDGRVSIVAGSHVPLIKGGAYENLYHFLFRVEGGLIREGYEFADTFVSAQMFAAPPGEG